MHIVPAQYFRVSYDNIEKSGEIMALSRVKYYGSDDLSAGWNLKKAEQILQSWDNDIYISDVNRVIEFYNIQKYFSSSARLDNWDDDTYAGYKNQCKKISELLGRFFDAISDATIESTYRRVERNYLDDFWQLLCDFKVYERITPDTIKGILADYKSALKYVLSHKLLVMRYSEVITDCLCNHEQTAVLLINSYLVAQDQTNKPLFFPAEFTQDMRNQRLNAYVDLPAPNLNFLQLLWQAQSTKEFPISNKLKLKARKKCTLLEEQLLKTSPKMAFEVNVAFKSIPDGSVEHYENGNIFYSGYSREWIEENQDYPTLLNNFIYLFQYVDWSFRCTFTSLKSDLGILERSLGVKGKRDYEAGAGFQIKNMQSTAQLQGYLQELNRLGIRIEDVFKWFFNNYLEAEFNARGFSYSPPSTGTTYAEKCKLLVSSIDGVLKQYRLFAEDGIVDRELLEISSEHIIFGDLPSLRTKKYAYANSQELLGELYLLFSDQSMLSYTDKTGEKYGSLPQLLLNEKMSKEDFKEYQLDDLQRLIERGDILSDKNGYLDVNKPRVLIFRDLSINEVICPRYYDTNLRQLVDSLVASCDMEYENTLFSRPERDYLNYMLNKSEFSNGLDLRNKYTHDTCSLDEHAHFRDYLELLKIMVIIIIKINEEFCMR